MLGRVVRSGTSCLRNSSHSGAAQCASFSSKSRAAIDVHTHLYYSRYIDMLRTRKVAPRVIERDGKPRLIILPSEEDTKEKAISAGRVIDSNYWEFSQKLRFMDKHDIEASVVSLANPWLDFLPAEEARPLATALNEDLQAASEKSGGRFYGFGVLPTHDLDGCVAEVERISKLSKLRGLIMGSAGLGKGLDDPRLDKLWAKVESLGLVIFLHPHYGVGNELYSGYGHTLFLACGFTFETTVAVSRMILSGVFDRYPKLKMLLAHSGGTLPFLAGRLDACTKDDPAMAGRLKKAPSEYLKNLYFDSITYASPSVDCTTSFVGMDKVMFGTDCPFSISDPQTNYRAMEHLSSADQRAIWRDNAKRLLNLP